MEEETPIELLLRTPRAPEREEGMILLARQILSETHSPMELLRVAEGMQGYSSRSALAVAVRALRLSWRNKASPDSGAEEWEDEWWVERLEFLPDRIRQRLERWARSQR